MHPHVTELLARAHHQELERTAAAWRSAHPDGGTRQNRGRRRRGSARSARPAPAKAAGIYTEIETAILRDSSVRSARFLDAGQHPVMTSEFGVTASRGLAGRYLDVSMEVQCVRK